MSSSQLDTPTQWTQFSQYVHSPLSGTPRLLPQLPNPSPTLIDREHSASLDSISSHQHQRQNFDSFGFGGPSLSATTSADPELLLHDNDNEQLRTTNSSPLNPAYSPPSNRTPYQQAFKSMFRETDSAELMIQCKVCNQQVLPEQYQPHIQFHRDQLQELAPAPASLALATIVQPQLVALTAGAASDQKRKGKVLEKIANHNKMLKMSLPVTTTVSEIAIPSYPDPQFDHLFRDGNSNSNSSGVDVGDGSFGGFAAPATTLTNVYCASTENQTATKSTSSRTYFKKTKAQTACFLCLACAGEYARRNYAKTHGKECVKIKQGLTESLPIPYSVVEFPSNQTLQYAKCEWQQLHSRSPKPIEEVIEFVRRMQSANYSHWNIVSSGASLVDNSNNSNNVLLQSLVVQAAQAVQSEQSQYDDNPQQQDQSQYQYQQQQAQQQYHPPDSYAASSTLNRNRWLVN